jgi:hypothetical protein
VLGLGLELELALELGLGLGLGLGLELELELELVVEGSPLICQKCRLLQLGFAADRLRLGDRGAGDRHDRGEQHQV